MDSGFGREVAKSAAAFFVAVVIVAAMVGAGIVLLIGPVWQLLTAHVSVH